MPRRRHSRAQASARPSVAAAAARYARRALAPAVLALIVALLGPAARGARATHSWASSPVALDGLRVVRQAREDDCGPALVATLAAWSGRPVGLDAVSAQAALGPEGDGVSLAEFARLASLHGASGAWYAVPERHLGALPTPFVAHLQAGGAGHFVAVVAHGRGFAVVADPASGARAGLAAVLLRHYSGRAFVLDSPVAPTWEGT